MEQSRKRGSLIDHLSLSFVTNSAIHVAACDRDLSSHKRPFHWIPFHRTSLLPLINRWVWLITWDSVWLASTAPKSGNCCWYYYDYDYYYYYLLRAMSQSWPSYLLLKVFIYDVVALSLTTTDHSSSLMEKAHRCPSWLKDSWHTHTLKSGCVCHQVFLFGLLWTVSKGARSD